MPIKITKIETVVTMECTDLPVHQRKYTTQYMHVDRATVKLAPGGKTSVDLIGVLAKKDGTRGAARRVEYWASQESEACRAVVAAAREAVTASPAT